MGVADAGIKSGVLTRESVCKGPGAEWPAFMTPKGLSSSEPRGASKGASSPVGGSNRKREELDEERKGGGGWM